MSRGLVFDMDGLIFDSEKVVQRTWYDVGKQIGIPDMGDYILHTLGFNKVKEKAYFREILGEEFPYELFTERTKERFYEIVDQEGMSVKPGARELIRYGKEHGLKLAVATSSREGYAVKLFQDAGIYDYFDGFVFGNMVTHSKPDPEIYQKACAAINLPAEACMAFEDAPAGVRSASAAGLTVVMVPDLVQPEEDVRNLAFQVCSSLTEAIPLVEQLRQGK